MFSGVGDYISKAYLIFLFLFFLPFETFFLARLKTSQTDNTVSSASGCNLLANVIQHRSLLSLLPSSGQREHNTTWYYRNRGVPVIPLDYFSLQETCLSNLTWHWISPAWWNGLLLLQSPLPSPSLFYQNKPLVNQIVLFYLNTRFTVGTTNASELFESRRIIIPSHWQWCLL